MPGTVTFTPTQDDWVAANRLWLSRARWRRWYRWFIGAVACLVAINLILQLAIEPDSLGKAMGDLAVPVIVLLAVTISYVVTPLAIVRGVRTQFAQRRTMGEQTVAEWDGSQLTVANASGRTTVRWTDLHRWLEDGRVFAFLLTDRMILMVPKRAMTADESADLATTAATCRPG